MRRLALVAAAALLLAGCGDLDTSYATTGSQSVNGIAVLRGVWQDDFAARVAGRLSERLDDADLLLHVARASDLPDDEACAWLKRWLAGRAHRQAVLVLRDGTPAAWLCRRWADEAADAAAADPAHAEALRAQAERLRARAREEELANAPPSPAGERAACPLFARVGDEPLAPRAFSGAIDGAAPPTLALRSHVEAARAETLIGADGRALVVAVPVGGGRLVVVANATALVDGALVHGDARRLLAALDRTVGDWRPAQGRRAAILARCAVRGDAASDAPNPLAMLFGTPPFSYALWHFLALGIAMLAWRAAWLGRVSPGRGRPLERFARHVDALAWHLRARGAWTAALGAIAAYLGRPMPDVRHPLEAREAAERLFTAGAREHRAPTAASPENA